MSNEDLDARLNLILDALPDSPPHGENRRHALTKHDMRLIIDVNKVLAGNQPCSLSFTRDQADSIVKMVHERRKIIALLGAVVIGVLVYVGEKALDLLSIGPWKSLSDWLHK